jgi:[ribosomal protein S5]-alanine N-acetyltransferase
MRSPRCGPAAAGRAPWPAVHDWASRHEACRYQTWGPNTPEETQTLVGRVVAAGAEPRTEFTLLAQLRDTGRVVGWGFAELGLHRVFGTCDPRNVASARVLRKLGMTHEGHMRHTALIRDGWRDSDLYALLEHEWRARPSSS